MGLGRWFRIDHEILLVGIRGKPPAPAPGTQSRSIIEAPVGAHSAKPECVLELIEAYFPTLPKVELNRRGSARAGWDAWGHEAVAPLAIEAAPPGSHKDDDEGGA
jgi:N6-adenosine-specific RNA methylase IME4